MQAQLQKHTSPLSADQAAQLERLVETLNPTQATWISGYLAGLNAALSEGAVAPAPLAGAGDAPALTILYGSQTGNAQGVAEQLKGAAEARGLAATLADMATYKPRDLKKEKNLLVLVSTHGEGDPPDDAEELHEFLHGNKAPKLGGLRFSVLALGDTSYEQFCQTGKEFDLRLAELGAERVHERIECDLDYEDKAEGWVAGVVEIFSDSLEADAAHPTVTRLPPAVAAAAAGPTRKNPFAARLFTNQVLNGRGSDKEVRHIELDSEDSGLVWEPGDSLGVIPTNDAAVVNELLAALGLGADEPVTGLDGESALGDALTRDFEITTLTRPLVENYARLAGSAQLDDLVAQDNRKTLSEWMYPRHLVDLVEQYPINGLGGNDFVRLLRKLPPRLYSIASSHAANPDEVHLTVAALRYASLGRARRGVASIQLADRAETDGSVPVYVDRNKNFRLPSDGDTGLIMIGPGTGVAPFRAFLEEREQAGATGRNWLFFGAQHFLTDFYYQSDWLRWRQDGLLTRLDVAFSRDQAEKCYVQHRLREQAAAVYSWLEAGAHVYVCGDADHMAHDVHQALIDVISEQGGHQPDAAAHYLKQMQKEKRYQRDVY